MHVALLISKNSKLSVWRFRGKKEERLTAEFSVHFAVMDIQYAIQDNETKWKTKLSLLLKYLLSPFLNISFIFMLSFP